MDALQPCCNWLCSTAPDLLCSSRGEMLVRSIVETALCVFNMISVVKVAYWFSVA